MVLLGPSYPSLVKREAEGIVSVLNIPRKSSLAEIRYTHEILVTGKQIAVSIHQNVIRDSYTPPLKISIDF